MAFSVVDTFREGIMKIRVFAGKKPIQKELSIPDDVTVVVLNSDSEISVCYETEHGWVDEDDKPIVVKAWFNR